MNEAEIGNRPSPRGHSSMRKASFVREALRDPNQIVGVAILLVLLLIALNNLLPWNGKPADYQPDQFVRQLLFGLAQGSIYALVALGYAMIYSVIGAINFAHGELFMAGAYAGFFAMLASQSGGLLTDNPLLALLMVLTAGTMGSVLAALVLERTVFRPLRRAPRLNVLIASIGASVVFQQIFSQLFGASARRYPDVSLYAFPQWFPGRECQIVNGTEVCRGIDLIGGHYDEIILGMQLRVLPIHALVLILALGLMLAFWFYVERTRMGRAMRAASEDKIAASLMGVDVDQVITVTFVLGAVLAGAGGVLFALYNHQVSPNMGFMPGIKALTAAILGGFGNLLGAVLGGYFLGVTESVLPSMLGLSAQFKDAITFLILVIALVFRPFGWFGKSQDEGRASS